MLLFLVGAAAAEPAMYAPPEPATVASEHDTLVQLRALAAQAAAMKIDGPTEPMSQRATDELLTHQLIARVKAYAALEKVATELANSAAAPEVRLEALVLMAEGREGVAAALLASYIPPYLTPDQAELDGMMLWDKASLQLDRAVAYWRQAAELVATNPSLARTELGKRVKAGVAGRSKRDPVALAREKEMRRVDAREAPAREARRRAAIERLNAQLDRIDALVREHADCLPVEIADTGRRVVEEGRWVAADPDFDCCDTYVPDALALLEAAIAEHCPAAPTTPP